MAGRKLADMATRWSGGGRPAESIRAVTLTNRCYLCTWIVVEPGPGLACISELRYINNCCSVRHAPEQDAPLALVGEA